ncbi:right-handed parallel beta-helix repeat-containing protein, partial [Candidatus Thorarchaeota archaeon]
MEGLRMRKLLFVGIVTTILIWSITSGTIFMSDGIESERTNILSETYIPHDPIVVSSNDDFTTEGFSGEGSPGNPFLIEWFEFTSNIDDACISISNTTAWFRIINCSFAPDSFASAITLYNVSNGQIQYSITGENAWSILVNQSSEVHLGHLTLSGTCIFMEQSWMCSVSHCSIYGAPGDGIYFYDCSQMTIDGCDISNCAATGIALENTGESTIMGNMVHDNFLEQIFIYGGSSVVRVHDNEIHVGMNGGA